MISAISAAAFFETDEFGLCVSADVWFSAGDAIDANGAMLNNKASTQMTEMCLINHFVFMMWPLLKNNIRNKKAIWDSRQPGSYIAFNTQKTIFLFRIAPGIKTAFRIRLPSCGDNLKTSYICCWLTIDIMCSCFSRWRYFQNIPILLWINYSRYFSFCQHELFSRQKRKYKKGSCEKGISLSAGTSTPAKLQSVK